MVKSRDSKKSKRVTIKNLKKNKNKNENMKRTRSTTRLQRDSAPVNRFPKALGDLETCWNTQKEVFFTERECHEKKKYHDNMNGCGAIDSAIEERFGRTYKKKLFTYYNIVGTQSPSLLKRLISKENISEVGGNFVLLLKPRAQLANENISTPSQYEEKFPRTFTPEFIFGNDKTVLENGKKWIANCVTDRIKFRDLCVKDCNQKLLDEEHQNFIRKLQVLYAQTVINHRRAKK